MRDTGFAKRKEPTSKNLKLLLRRTVSRLVAAEGPHRKAPIATPSAPTCSAALTRSFSEALSAAASTHRAQRNAAGLHRTRGGRRVCLVRHIVKGFLSQLWGVPAAGRLSFSSFAYVGAQLTHWRT